MDAIYAGPSDHSAIDELPRRSHSSQDNQRSLRITRSAATPSSPSAQWSSTRLQSATLVKLIIFVALFTRVTRASTRHQSQWSRLMTSRSSDVSYWTPFSSNVTSANVRSPTANTKVFSSGNQFVRHRLSGRSSRASDLTDGLISNSHYYRPSSSERHTFTGGFTAQCGYSSCHPTNPSVINVHIICHTHLDTGWIMTYDEYYYKFVRRIYDSVIASLNERDDRRFIAVETSFFSRWYNNQSARIKGLVDKLVKRGQLEFISGGWVMNDEATTYYQEIIDQMTHGHRWLNDTFGSCGVPRVGWQIDPFGHSREFASLISQMSFDGLFLGRVDFQDKEQREYTRTLEMIWKASPSLGSRADMFTSILPNVYWPPSGFCWEVDCHDQELTGENIAHKAMLFVDMMKKQAHNYASNHTVVTMGMDFYYKEADKWYRNLDKLIAYINAREAHFGMRLLYSTPSCYLKSLHESRRQWPVKLDDFFPYADANNTYWTGYFTSRPTFKYAIKFGNNILQTLKQLHSLVMLNDVTSIQAVNSLNKMHSLQSTIGILQHHDAVTGTSPQAVINDYQTMLSRSITDAQEAIGECYNRLWFKEGFVPSSSPFIFCNHLNESMCRVTESIEENIMDAVMVIYNPLGHSVKHYVRLPIRGALGYRIRDSNGTAFTSQVVPLPPSVINLPSRARASLADSELLFRVALPPLGFTTVAIDKQPEAEAKANQNWLSSLTDEENNRFDEDVTIGNQRISVTFDRRSGLQKSVGTRSKQISMSQNFMYYESQGRIISSEKPSGAYAFNPLHSSPKLVTKSQVDLKVIRGPLVEEVHQVFSPYVSQIVRVYQNVDYIEYDWIIGPIPLSDRFYDPGNEIISRYSSSLNSSAYFFTDANGRETIRRVRHHRPTFKVETTEPVASNYYPVTSWIFIRDYDQDVQLTILPDRPQGGSSLLNGTIELMVHRRTTIDDGFGMEEPLNEIGPDGRGLIARGKHRVIVADIQDSIRQMRMMSKSTAHRPLMAFKKRNLSPTYSHYRSVTLGNTGNSFDTSLPKPLSNSRFIGLNRKLPANINLLTLEPWGANKLLLRLEHIFEVNEDLKFSHPRRLNLTDLFTPFIVISVEETTLNVIQEKSKAESRRLKFFPVVDPYFNYTNMLTELDSDDLPDVSPNDALRNSNVITIYPMEIRTFLISYIERSNCLFNGPELARNPRIRTPNCS